LASHRGNFYSRLGNVAAVPLMPHDAMLEVEFAEFSDPGRVREHNEDFLGHALPASPSEGRSRGWLFALADGVGGHERGEVASKIAVESVVDGFRRAGAGEAHSGLLQRLLHDANLRVYETGMASAGGGVLMATTLVACALRHDRATIAHVGDSRCYLVRHGSATPLTRDHTVVNDQVRLGLLSAEDAADADTRHVLTRSLGNGLFVNTDIKEHIVIPGDVLVLCCDGLYGSLPVADIATLASDGADLQNAARGLVDLANERDGGDNISVQLIRICSVERIGMYRGRPYKLR
jgi:PPM family protein phosphatase